MVRLAAVATCALGLCAHHANCFVSVVPPSRCLSSSSSGNNCALRWPTQGTAAAPAASALAASSQDVASGAAGIQLPAREESAATAQFLAQAIQTHLDEDWLPQECHQAIGAEVARIYQASVAGGNTDLNQLVLETGTSLERFDMGDAFVGCWDVANLVSDFMIARMGLESCGCSTPLPRGLGAAVGAAAGGVELTEQSMRELADALHGEFGRYRWLSGVLEELVEWGEINAVMAVYLGYRPAAGALDNSAVPAAWRSLSPLGAPDFRRDSAAVELLLQQLPQHPDDQDSLDHFIEVLYGEAAKKMAEAAEDRDDYDRRCAIVKWLYANDFLKTPLADAAAAVAAA